MLGFCHRIRGCRSAVRSRKWCPWCRRVSRRNILLRQYGLRIVYCINKMYSSRHNLKLGNTTLILNKDDFLIVTELPRILGHLYKFWNLLWVSQFMTRTQLPVILSIFILLQSVINLCVHNMDCAYYNVIWFKLLPPYITVTLNPWIIQTQQSNILEFKTFAEPFHQSIHIKKKVLEELF